MEKDDASESDELRGPDYLDIVNEINDFIASLDAPPLDNHTHKLVGNAPSPSSSSASANSAAAVASSASATAAGRKKKKKKTFGNHGDDGDDDYDVDDQPPECWEGSSLSSSSSRGRHRSGGGGGGGGGDDDSNGHSNSSKSNARGGTDACGGLLSSSFSVGGVADDNNANKLMKPGAEVDDTYDNTAFGVETISGIDFNDATTTTTTDIVSPTGLNELLGVVGGDDEGLLDESSLSFERDIEFGVGGDANVDTVEEDSSVVGQFPVPVPILTTGDDNSFPASTSTSCDPFATYDYVGGRGGDGGIGILSSGSSTTGGHGGGVGGRRGGTGILVSGNNSSSIGSHSVGGSSNIGSHSSVGGSSNSSSANLVPPPPPSSSSSSTDYCYYYGDVSSEDYSNTSSGGSYSIYSSDDMVGGGGGGGGGGGAGGSSSSSGSGNSSSNCDSDSGCYSYSQYSSSNNNNNNNNNSRIVMSTPDGAERSDVDPHHHHHHHHHSFIGLGSSARSIVSSPPCSTSAPSSSSSSSTTTTSTTTTTTSSTATAAAAQTRCSATTTEQPYHYPKSSPSLSLSSSSSSSSPSHHHHYTKHNHHHQQQQQQQQQQHHHQSTPPSFLPKDLHNFPRQFQNNQYHLDRNTTSTNQPHLHHQHHGHGQGQFSAPTSPAVKRKLFNQSVVAQIKTGRSLDDSSHRLTASSSTSHPSPSVSSPSYSGSRNLAGVGAKSYGHQHQEPQEPVYSTIRDKKNITTTQHSKQQLQHQHHYQRQQQQQQRQLLGHHHHHQHQPFPDTSSNQSATKQTKQPQQHYHTPSSTSSSSSSAASFSPPSIPNKPIHSRDPDSTTTTTTNPPPPISLTNEPPPPKAPDLSVLISELLSVAPSSCETSPNSHQTSYTDFARSENIVSTTHPPFSSFSSHPASSSSPSSSPSNTATTACQTHQPHHDTSSYSSLSSTGCDEIISDIDKHFKEFSSSLSSSSSPSHYQTPPSSSLLLSSPSSFLKHHPHSQHQHHHHLHHPSEENKAAASKPGTATTNNNNKDKDSNSYKYNTNKSNQSAGGGSTASSQSHAPSGTAAPINAALRSSFSPEHDYEPIENIQLDIPTSPRPETKFPHPPRGPVPHHPHPRKMADVSGGGPQPQQQQQQQPKHVKALHSFKGSNNDELCFKKGDIITVTQCVEGGWWEGTLSGRTGWFPSNYAKEVRADIGLKSNKSGDVPVYKRESMQLYHNVVLKNVIETEKTHVSEMIKVLQSYIKPIEGANLLSGPEYKLLVGNLEEVIAFQQTFLSALEECEKLPSSQRRIGGVFMQFAPDMKEMYSLYCANHPRSVSVLQTKREDLSKFVEGVGALTPGAQTLTSILSKPFTRLDKYPSLLKELERHVEESHPDRGDTQRAIAVYKNIANSCSEIRKMKEMEHEIITSTIQGWEGEEISKLGEVLHLSQVKLHTQTGEKFERIFLLFQSCLVMLSMSSRLSSYQYEGNVPLSSLSSATLVDSGDCFEIHGPMIEKITVSCGSKQEATTWMELLNNLVSNSGQPASSAKPQPLQVHMISTCQPSVSTVTSAKTAQISSTTAPPPSQSAINNPPPSNAAPTPPSSQNPLVAAKTSCVWSLTCLRPSPPLRPSLMCRDEVLKSPRAVRKSTQKRKPDDPKVYNEDAFILQVIEAYCNSVKTRHTVNSCRIEVPPDPKKKAIEAIVGGGVVAKAGTTTTTTTTTTGASTKAILNSPQILLAEEEKIFDETEQQERTVVDTVYALQDRVKDLEQEQRKLRADLDEERRCRRKLEMLVRGQMIKSGMGVIDIGSGGGGGETNAA